MEAVTLQRTERFPEGRRRAVIVGRLPLWLNAVERALEQIGIAAPTKLIDPRSVLDEIDDKHPALLIFDLADENGTDQLELLRRVQELAPSVRIVVVAASDAPDDVAAAFEAGAVVYVLKTASVEDFRVSVRQAVQQSLHLQGPRASAPDAPEMDHLGLTKREVEVLNLAAEGYSNADLGKRLRVKEQTVKFHLGNIYRKLGAANRTEAARKAHLYGLLPGDRVPTSSPGA